MIKIDVFVQDRNWKKYIPNPSRYINHKKKYIKSVLDSLKIKKINFSILLAGHTEIKKLNKKFRKKNKSTDVLSFPFYNIEDLKGNKNKSIYIGDIVLNFKKIDKKNFKMDFNRLWIHGFLHLLGYKHFKDKDFYKMNKLEKKILKKIKGNEC
tara:strand:+ start:53 stop:511 length:459 start_codon:yes stop_codon:yes gene_type:complete